MDGNEFEELVTSQNDITNELLNFKLYQNYPNPFNPATKIAYSIPQRSFVILEVYNVLGNEVSTLVIEDKPAGEYEIEFDGGGLTSGIYFYKLETGFFLKQKK